MLILDKFSSFSVTNREALCYNNKKKWYGRKGLSWLNRTYRRLSIFVTFILLILSFNLNVKAISQEKSSIEDSYHFFTDEEKSAMDDEINQLPEIYKIIILPTVHSSIENIGKTYFKHNNLSQDTILILVVTDDKKIFATTGEALQKKGLDDAFFQQAINNYFVPSAKTKHIYEALIDLIQGISKDIPKYIVNEKNPPKIQIPSEQAVSTPKNDEANHPSKLLYIIVTGVAVLVTGFIFSKGIYIKK